MNKSVGFDVRVTLCVCVCMCVVFCVSVCVYVCVRAHACVYLFVVRVRA